jgi:hypothetical protein
LRDTVRDRLLAFANAIYSGLSVEATSNGSEGGYDFPLRNRECAIALGELLSKKTHCPCVRSVPP